MKQPPYVAVAAFFVAARQNADGTLSLDRMIDRVTIQPATPRPWLAPLTAVVALRCAPEDRTHVLGLRAREPDQDGTRSLLSLPVDTTIASRNVALEKTVRRPRLATSKRAFSNSHSDDCSSRRGSPAA